MKARPKSRLLIVGAGGLGREVAEAARHPYQNPWQHVVFLDENTRLHGRTVGGLQVAGGLEAAGAADTVVLAAARPDDPGRRLRLAAHPLLAHARFASILHPMAALGASVDIGQGSVILAGAVLTADVTVGLHVVLMPAVVLTHDDVLGDGVTVGAGACLAGGVTVGAGAYLGSGCLIREGLRIGAGALVGMGAVVTRDVPAGETWVGVPARPLARLSSGTFDRREVANR